MPYKPTGRPPGRPRKGPPGADPSVKPDGIPRRIWRAVEVEVAFYAQPDADWSKGPPVGEVARAAGVTRHAIRQRRKDQHYQAAIDWRYRQLLLEDLAAQLGESDAKRDEEREDAGSWWSREARQRIAGYSAEERERYLLWSTRNWARRVWHERDLLTGPVTHLDPRSFSTPEDWAEALVKAGHFPTEEPKPPLE